MKKQDSISIGIVGVGYLGKFHLYHLKSIKKITISGIFDIDLERAKIISNKYNVNIFNNLKYLYNNSDAIIVVTPTNSHYKIAHDALDADCHVFIEKPITDNLLEAKKLLKKAKKMKKIIQVGHIERFNPAFRKLKKLKIKPIFIESHRLASFNSRGLEIPVVLDLMIHDIDILLSLIDTKVKRINANGVNVISNSIDIANARIEFENGSIANLTASRISQKEMRKMRFFQKDNYLSVDFKNKIIEQFSINKNYNNITRKNKILVVLV